MNDQPLFFATLPYGPTMNTYWRTRVIVTKGNPKGAFASTYVSESGIAFQLSVKAVVHAKYPNVKLTGPLAINVLASPPDKRNRDLDNLLKPLLDALMYAGLYEDDSQFSAIFIRRGEVIKGGSMLVQIIQDTHKLSEKELF